MSTAIKLKRSTTQGSTPTTANLAEGELALNVYDGKLFFKKNNGTESIVSLETYSADSPLPTEKGGLGQSFTPGTGQVPIGNADGSFTLNRILAGTGMQVVSGDGSITVSYTGENTTSAVFAPQATSDLGLVGLVGLILKQSKLTSDQIVEPLASSIKQPSMTSKPTCLQ